MKLKLIMQEGILFNQLRYVSMLTGIITIVNIFTVAVVRLVVTYTVPPSEKYKFVF